MQKLFRRAVWQVAYQWRMCLLCNPMEQEKDKVQKIQKQREPWSE